MIVEVLSCLYKVVTSILKKIMQVCIWVGSGFVFVLMSDVKSTKTSPYFVQNVYKSVKRSGLSSQDIDGKHHKHWTTLAF